MSPREALGATTHSGDSRSTYTRGTWRRRRPEDAGPSAGPVPVRDRRATVPPEGPAGDLHARRRLPAFVLRPIDQLDDPLDDGRGEAGCHDLVGAAVLLDV